MRERFDAKRAAGWTDVRRDGSKYSGDVDDIAGKAEAWAADCCGAKIDEDIYLHGDPGWDFTVDGLKVDVIHIGDNRDPKNAHVIINPDHPKLKNADVLLVVGNNQDFWYALGVISVPDFNAKAERKNFNFGAKLAIHCRELSPVRSLLRAFAGTEFSLRLM